MTILLISYHTFISDNGSIDYFDLEHLLDLLAPQSIAASWIVSDGEGEGVETIGISYGILESLGLTGERISGTVLTAIARKTTQIIWGEFTGYLPAESEKPWVILRAFDNSYWEVETADQDVVALVKRRFKNVRETAATWTNPDWLLLSGIVMPADA